MSSRSVRRVTSAHSQAFLVMQQALLLNIVQELEIRRPDWSMAFQMWDETGEKLKFLVNNRLMAVTMQVFVMTISFSWGWATGETQSFEYICPPFPVSRVTAPRLWDALRTHPFSRPAWQFMKRLEELTTHLPLQCRTTDSASGNTKLLAFALTVATAMLWSLPCLNHQCFLGHLDMLIGCSFYLSAK